MSCDATEIPKSQGTDSITSARVRILGPMWSCLCEEEIIESSAVT